MIYSIDAAKIWNAFYFEAFILKKVIKLDEF
jgi:hypothetical protein